MFRLMKLLVLVLAGYLLYEFYQGFSEVEAEPKQPRGGGSRARGGGSRSGRQRVPITGGGEGASTRTQESGGTSTPVRVGRGVRH